MSLRNKVVTKITLVTKVDEYNLQQFDITIRKGFRGLKLVLNKIVQTDDCNFYQCSGFFVNEEEYIGLIVNNVHCGVYDDDIHRNYTNSLWKDFCLPFHGEIQYSVEPLSSARCSEITFF